MLHLSHTVSRRTESHAHSGATHECACFKHGANRSEQHVCVWTVHVQETVRTIRRNLISVKFSRSGFSDRGLQSVLEIKQWLQVCAPIVEVHDDRMFRRRLGWLTAEDT